MQGQIRTEVSTHNLYARKLSGGYLKLFEPFCSNMMELNEMISQENSGSFYPLPSIPPFRGSFREHLKGIFWTKVVGIQTFWFYFMFFYVQLSTKCGGWVTVRVKLFGVTLLKIPVSHLT